MEVNHFRDETYPFNRKTAFTDLILLVEGKQLYVNKFVLMIASPVFKAMFTLDFKEKDCKEIKLPEKTVKDVVQFLKCIYPDIMDPINGSNVYGVLPLADFYDCQVLKERCEFFLKTDISKNTMVENVIKCTLAAEKYSLKVILADCIIILSRKRKDSVHCHPCWNEVFQDTRVEILTKRVELLESIFKIASQLVLKPEVVKFQDEEYAELFGMPVEIEPVDDFKLPDIGYETYRKELSELFSREMPKIFDK